MREEYHQVISFLHYYKICNFNFQVDLVKAAVVELADTLALLVDLEAQVLFQQPVF